MARRAVKVEVQPHRLVEAYVRTPLLPGRVFHVFRFEHDPQPFFAFTQVERLLIYWKRGGFYAEKDDKFLFEITRTPKRWSGVGGVFLPGKGDELFYPIGEHDKDVWGWTYDREPVPGLRDGVQGGGNDRDGQGDPVPPSGVSFVPGGGNDAPGDRGEGGAA